MYHTTEYHNEFWNAMKGKSTTRDKIDTGRNRQKNSYRLPHESDKKFAAARKQENIFRQIATVTSATNDSTVWTFDNETVAAWLNPTNPKFFENITAYNKLAIREHELGSAILLPEDFAAEAGFDVEAYVTKEFAKCIGRTEEDAFINGTGNDQPRGFLQDALVGVSTADITYDDVIKLYFSQKKEYRRNGVWMMSDETALKLRTIKDADGNYLWNQHDNTILGKPVYISEYMPAAQAGARPIAFGDFSYYWIVDRAPFVMRRLNEIFALSQQIGFLGYEFIDAKLVKPEAIRVMEITE